MSETLKTHRECYGGMVPDFEHLRYNRPTEGKAFQVLVQKIGLGTQRRDLVFKPEAWEECAACPDYPTCYDLSMGKLALHMALARS